MRGIVITVLPLLLHYFNEVRLYSSFFKLQQVKPEFGGILVDTLIHEIKGNRTAVFHNADIV